MRFVDFSVEGMLIILSSSGLAFITALSVSAISSNGLAQGGMYLLDELVDPNFRGLYRAPIS